MEQHIRAMFDNLSNRRREQEEKLSRLEVGDMSGMVSIFENGFPDEVAQLSFMKADTYRTLAAIEEDTVELENITGQNRP